MWQRRCECIVYPRSIGRKRSKGCFIDDFLKSHQQRKSGYISSFFIDWWNRYNKLQSSGKIKRRLDSIFFLRQRLTTDLSREKERLKEKADELKKAQDILKKIHLQLGAIQVTIPSQILISSLHNQNIMFWWRVRGGFKSPNICSCFGFHRACPLSLKRLWTHSFLKFGKFWPISHSFHQNSRFNGSTIIFG